MSCRHARIAHSAARSGPKRSTGHELARDAHARELNVRHLVDVAERPIVADEQRRLSADRLSGRRGPADDERRDEAREEPLRDRADVGLGHRRERTTPLRILPRCDLLAKSTRLRVKRTQAGAVGGIRNRVLGRHHALRRTS
jgi:hypothetical protein